jgi:hypothetical protein
MFFIIHDVGEFFKFFNSGDLGFTLLLIFLFCVSPIIAFGFSAKAFIERKNEYKRLSICNINLKEVYLFEDSDELRRAINEYIAGGKENV